MISRETSPTPANFESLPRPRVKISNDEILIADPPIAKRIFLAFVFASLPFIVKLFGVQGDISIGIGICVVATIGFAYDSLSLQRVRISFENKIIYRKSLNPIENILNSLVKRPFEIPFSDVNRIFSDYTITFAPASQRYYVYLLTKKGKKMVLCTLDKEPDANTFAVFLNRKVKAYRN
jgi:hypothetical protein